MAIFVQGIIVFLIVRFCFSALPNEDEVLVALENAKTIGRIEHGLGKIERNLHGSTFSRGCPMAVAHGQRLYGDTTMDRNVNSVLRAMRILQNKNGHTLREVTHVKVLDFFERSSGTLCAAVHPPGKCDIGASYRSADGSCNNLDHPAWGMALTTQERLLSSAYDDNLGTPRMVGLNDNLLPNARRVSNLVHNAVNEITDLSKTLTLMVMGFGQFLDHDITLTPEISEYDECCEKTAGKDIDNCFNIISPEADIFQPIFNKGHCIEFKRSSPVLCKDSQSKGVSVRQQLNAITSYIDGSNIYGSSLKQRKELRTENGEGYFLKISIQNGKERILNGDDCLPNVKKRPCSKAGDIRVNEVPTLTSMHYLFVKEHNRIAEKLKDFYNDQDKETVFQETKKLVTAIIQKIVYDEFLPSFLSKATMDKYNLKISNKYEYDKTLNPSVINSFAAAAYRMGHSLVPSDINLLNKNFQKITNEARKTEDTFFDPSMTYRPRAFSRLMYGLSGSASPASDSFLVEAVRSNLFVNTSKNFALDLAALNIQRGRDHGLPSYNEYRKLCGLEELNENWKNESLDGLVDGIKQKLIDAGYKSPRDIDLFTGGLIEKPVPGGHLGQTFECLIGEQFKRLKFGDRFWFQSHYSSKQIEEIQKYSFSKLLCVNYKYNKIQYPSAFKLTIKMTKCKDIKDIDITVFNPHGSRNPELRTQQEVLDIEKKVLKQLLEELENE